jgi:hypothetical protein
MKKIFIKLYFFSMFFFARTVYGQTILDKPPESALSKKGMEGAYDLITKTSGWLWNIIIAISVTLIIYGGFLFVTSSGDEKKIEEAKKYVLWSVVGIVVATTATGLVFLVGELLGGKTN